MHGRGVDSHADIGSKEKMKKNVAVGLAADPAGGKRNHLGLAREFGPLRVERLSL